MRSTLLVAVVALGLGGCAASPTTPEAEDATLPATPAAPAPRRPGNGTSEGDLAGTSLSIAEAVVLTGRLSEREPSRRGARIVLTMDASACSRADTVRAGGAILTFDIDFIDGAVPLGSYAVPEAFSAGAGSVVAQLDAATAECRRKTVVPSFGNVTVTSSEAGRIRGTFELTSGRDTMRGAFDAAPCPGSAAPSLIAARCQP